MYEVCLSLLMFQYAWFRVLVAGHTYVDGDLLSVRGHQQQVPWALEGLLRCRDVPPMQGSRGSGPSGPSLFHEAH